MAGEVTSSSVILQSRLTTGSYPFDGDVPGAAGVARFEISTDAEFSESFHTDWIEAVAERDFIVKSRVTGLKAGTRYHYRLVYGRSREQAETGPRRTFKTLAGKDVATEASFVVVTGMNYEPFQILYQGEDKHLGYPALRTILDMQPDFFVGTGDNVYYDIPSMKPNTPEPYRRPRATSQAELREKWHEQFVQPRYVNLFAEVPTYWEKDDHDYRYNDCDNTSSLEPSPELGQATFLEQVPIAGPESENPITYRNHRVNKLLEIWLTEGRDYRSPNMAPSGPEKTLWGAEQLAWLKETLPASDAAFKLLISPTPMIGPDDHFEKGPSGEDTDPYKRDNHSNPLGFQYERDEFFRWLLQHGLDKKGFYIVCGDRHWQYHSISPEGIEEFSCGALIDANSRIGRKPGDPESNDPDARIRQPYNQKEKSGGFLKVAVKPGDDPGSGLLELAWYDEHGTLLYSTTKTSGVD